MSNKNEASWVLDSLVGFLKSPVWNLSVLNFIEQKSVIFEPETEDQSDQNEALEQEYSKIFSEYKEMVDTLIGSHMEDLQISPSDFESACLEAKENLGSKLHSILFEQLWAAFNYRIFKRMMIQRNIDLQLQALELLGQKLNISSETLNASSLSPESQICEEELELMRELFKRNLSSNLSTTKQLEEDKPIESTTTAAVAAAETIVKTIEEPANSKQPQSSTQSKQQEITSNGQLAEQQQNNTLLNEDDSKVKRVSSAKRLSQSALIEKVLHNNDSNQSEQQQLDNDQKMLLLLGATQNGQQINKEDLEKRQNYLRAQRDKLIELKQKERSKQIAKVGDEQQQNNRPKSAKALRSSLKKNYSNEDDEDETNSGKVKKADENKENGTASGAGTGGKRAFSSMLAAKLKSELIGGNLADFKQDVIQSIHSSSQN